MGLNKLAVFFKMIKFEHSIFALPFAYMGAMVAANGFPSSSQILWITLAMVSARTFAMCLNRLIDKGIDAKNPRTRDRALVTGHLSVRDVSLFAALSLLLFILAAFNLAPLARLLAPLFVIPFVIYPYAKRFTWASHLVLGLCLGLAPVGAWIAVVNSVSITPVILGLAVTFWVAGFDIIYACQDIEVDREQGLHSIPARFGVGISLKFVAAFHIISVALFLLAARLAGLGRTYYAGIFIAASLLFFEDRLVSPGDLSKINTAFFSLNGMISVVVFIFTVLNYAI